MISVVYKINEIDCDVCLDFLIKKLKKYRISHNVFCDKCSTLTLELDNEKMINKVSKIILDAVYENNFKEIAKNKHHHTK